VNVYNKLQTAHLFPHNIAVYVSYRTFSNLFGSLLTSATTYPTQKPPHASANVHAPVRLPYPFAPKCSAKSLYCPTQIFSDFSNSLPLTTCLSFWIILHVHTYGTLTSLLIFTSGIYLTRFHFPHINLLSCFE